LLSFELPNVALNLFTSPVIEWTQIGFLLCPLNVQKANALQKALDYVRITTQFCHVLRVMSKFQKKCLWQWLDAVAWSIPAWPVDDCYWSCARTLAPMSVPSTPAGCSMYAMNPTVVYHTSDVRRAAKQSWSPYYLYYALSSYTVDLIAQIESHGLSAHLYANDTQVHGRVAFWQRRFTCTFCTLSLC